MELKASFNMLIHSVGPLFLYGEVYQRIEICVKIFSEFHFAILLRLQLYVQLITDANHVQKGKR